MRNVDPEITGTNLTPRQPKLAVRITSAFFLCILLLSAVFPFAAAEASVMYVSTDEGRIFQVSAAGVPTAFATLSHGSILPSLIFDGSGNLYVAEYQSNRISRISANGQVTPYANNILTPISLAFDHSGNLFTASDDSGDIVKISPTGVASTFATKTQLSGPGPLNYQPDSVAFGPDGNLYIAMNRNGKIMRATPDGTVSLFVNLSATKSAQPVDLKFDVLGNLFVSDANSGEILKVDPTGQISNFTSSQVQISPTGLAFDENGSLFVADYINNRIASISPDGQTATTFAKGINYPRYIAFAPIPEPSLMYLLPFAAALFMRRRQPLQLVPSPNPSRIEQDIYAADRHH
jgi:sugar lactone lactonase YvrE